MLFRFRSVCGCLGALVQSIVLWFYMLQFWQYLPVVFWLWLGLVTLGILEFLGGVTSCFFVAFFCWLTFHFAVQTVFFWRCFTFVAHVDGISDYLILFPLFKDRDFPKYYFRICSCDRKFVKGLIISCIELNPPCPNPGWRIKN